MSDFHMIRKSDGINNTDALNNKDLYKKNLDIIRYKRDVAEGVN